MAHLVADDEFRRGFPVGVESRRRHLVGDFRVREGRAGLVRRRVRNHVRDVLRSANLASNHLVGRLRNADDPGADAAVQTFVLVHASAELIVRER